MKPLLVGEAPGPNGDPEKPLEGRPASRLLAVMRIDGPRGGPRPAAELAKHFEVRNLLDEPMARPEGTKGCEWPKEEAAAAAKRLATLLELEQPVVFLGKRVAEAFDFRLDYFEWSYGALLQVARVPAVIIPHPSGIVRLWNDPTTGVQAGYTLWQALGKIPR